MFGFGRDTWAALAPDSVPDDLVRFEPISGAEGFTHPGAQHDLWIWFHGGAPDALFDLGRASQKQLAGLATLAAERNCFAYGPSRDLSGFAPGVRSAKSLTVAPRRPAEVGLYLRIPIVVARRFLILV